MQIVYDFTSIKFKDLNPGELFRLNTTCHQNILLKLKENNNLRLNTVNLTTNEPLHVVDNADIIPIKGKLVIE